MIEDTAPRSPRPAGAIALFPLPAVIEALDFMSHTLLAREQRQQDG